MNVTTDSAVAVNIIVFAACAMAWQQANRRRFLFIVEVKRRFFGVDASMGVELTQSHPECERLRHRSAMHRQKQCRRPCSAGDLQCLGAAKTLSPRCEEHPGGRPDPAAVARGRVADARRIWPAVDHCARLTRGRLDRPPLKGLRLPKLSAVLANKNTVWTSVVVSQWYNEQQRKLLVATGTAVWYHAGIPPVPIRWVLVRDPSGEHEPSAFLSAELAATPATTLGSFVSRWRVETTFQ